MVLGEALSMVEGTCGGSLWIEEPAVAGAALLMAASLLAW